MMGGEITVCDEIHQFSTKFLKKSPRITSKTKGLVENLLTHVSPKRESSKPMRDHLPASVCQGRVTMEVFMPV